MTVLFTWLILLSALTDPGKISKVNALKNEARKAYNAGDYSSAISKYKMLKDSLQVTEDEVTLNLANAYFQSNDTTAATAEYQQLLASPTPTIRSKANQQLGILNNRQGKFEEALNSFKQAIKADPNNMDARYNYEMLKKKLEEKKKEEEQKKKDEEQKDQKPQDQKDQQKKEEQQKKEQQQKQDEKNKSENKDEQSKQEEQKKEDQKKSEQEKENEKPSDEKKDTPPSVSEKLQQMKISEEKAKMLLEAMKNQEVQYLQQNKRKATKPKDKGKPDW